jgi:hypothetical protein
MDNWTLGRSALQHTTGSSLLKGQSIGTAAREGLSDDGRRPRGALFKRAYSACRACELLASLLTVPLYQIVWVYGQRSKKTVGFIVDPCCKIERITGARLRSGVAAGE